MTSRYETEARALITKIGVMEAWTPIEIDAVADALRAAEERGAKKGALWMRLEAVVAAYRSRGPYPHASMQAIAKLDPAEVVARAQKPEDDHG